MHFSVILTATFVLFLQIASDSNAVGNIVLLATEQMEIGSVEHNGVHSSNTTDEELTSLTWLQDKNLLKGNTLFS